MNEYLVCKTFDEIEIGDSAFLVRTLTGKDIQLFAAVTGDVNPAHVDPEYAKDSMFHQIIAHGLWGGTLISSVLGTLVPGAGTIYISQSFNFLRPVFVGDTITAKVTVVAKNQANHHVTLDCVCANQHGKDVITGQAIIIAPLKKVRVKKINLPEVDFAGEYKF